MADTTIAELLKVNYIIDKLSDASVQEQVIVYEELKAEAKKLGVVKSFNKIAKEAQLTVIQRNQRKLISENKLADMPACIPNTAGYIINDYGIKLFMPNMDTTIEICSKPLFITERYQDIETNKEKVKLVYKSDNKWYSTVVSRQIIANSNKILDLAELPTGINSDNSRNVIKYLNDIESLNRGSIDIKKSVSSLGWTEHGFVPFIDDIVFAGTDQYNKLYSKMTTKGTLEKWKQLHILSVKHAIPKVALACAYGSILLKPLGVNGFCVHIWGSSGSGKTVSTMIATSVYGDADNSNGLIHNGGMTENAVESIMGFYGNCMLALDELTNQSPEQLTKLVYKISNGQGKDRMTRSAGMQKVYSWNNITLSNAEPQITDDRSLSGMINRLVQIHSEDNIFEGIDAKQLVSDIKQNYGFGAKLFIEALSKCNPMEIFNAYRQSIPPDYEPKQVNSVCVLLTAYDIACKYIYEIPNDFTFDYFKDIIQTKDQTSMTNRNYNILIEYIDANYMYFQEPYDDSRPTNIQRWGKYSTDGYIYMLPERFNEWCYKNKINSNSFLKGLQSKNLLKTTSEKRLKFKTSGITLSGTQVWYIAIKEKIDNLFDKLKEVKDENIPF